MAKVEISVVDVPVTTITKKKVVTIELDEYEAEVLKHITGSIIGDSSKSIRGVADRIYHALDKKVPKDISLDYDPMRVENDETSEQYLKESK
jgi:phage-related protein